MTKRKAASDVGRLLRDRLQSVASQAVQAQGMSPQDDSLLDLVDDIDRDLQAVIEIINRVRREEV